MYLQERLEVQVGHLLSVLHAQQLAQLGVRDDTALEVGVKAVVRLHILGHELGHIRLRALRLGGQAHKGGQLIRNRAQLQEGVVRATSLPNRTLLRGQRGRIHTATALRVTGLTAQGTRGLRGLVEQITHTGRHISRQGTQLGL